MYHDSNIVEPTAIWIPAEAGMTMDGHVCHTAHPELRQSRESRFIGPVEGLLGLSTTDIGQLVRQAHHERTLRGKVVFPLS